MRVALITAVYDGYDPLKDLPADHGFDEAICVTDGKGHVGVGWKIIIEDGIVRNVIVIPFMDDDDAKVTAYCNSIGLAGTWVDTSYLGSRRGKYAGLGDSYNEELNEFVSPSSEPVV